MDGFSEDEGNDVFTTTEATTTVPTTTEETTTTEIVTTTKSPTSGVQLDVSEMSFGNILKTIVKS